MAELNTGQFLGGILGIDRNPPTDRSDSGPENDAEWKNTPVEMVPVRELIATQTYLDAGKVEHYRQGGGRKGRKMDDTPRVSVENGRPYLIDGHHRAVAAGLEGEPLIEARVKRG